MKIATLYMRDKLRATTIIIRALVIHFNEGRDFEHFCLAEHCVGNRCLQFILSDTELDIGVTILLFEAWQVRIACKCSRPNFSNRSTLRTLLVPTAS